MSDTRISTFDSGALEAIIGDTQHLIEKGVSLGDVRRYVSNRINHLMGRVDSFQRDTLVSEVFQSVVERDPAMFGLNLFLSNMSINDHMKLTLFCERNKITTVAGLCNLTEEGLKNALIDGGMSPKDATGLVKRLKDTLGEINICFAPTERLING